MLIGQQPWFKGLCIGISIFLGALVLTVLMVTQINLERIYLTSWLKSLWLFSILLAGFFSGWWSEVRGWVSGLWAGVAFSAIIGLILLPFGYPLNDVTFFLSIVFWSSIIAAVGGSWGINQKIWYKSRHLYRSKTRLF